jgi:MOSC domain-containing protein YiiM
MSRTVAAVGEAALWAPTVVEAAVEIVALVVSGVHAYAGRPSDGPQPEPGPAARDEVLVRAGKGLVGDRYFDHPAHRQAAVTVLAAESLEAVADELGLDRQRLDPVHARRNIVLRGFPIDTLATRRGAAGQRVVFSLDAGTGPVRFRAHRPADPCAWMDTQLAPGAWNAMRGRGGVRCEPLDDGVLRLGPATLRVWQAGSPPEAPRMARRAPHAAPPA